MVIVQISTTIFSLGGVVGVLALLFALQSDEPDRRLKIWRMTLRKASRVCTSGKGKGFFTG
jgi:hypothetical protein